MPATPSFDLPFEKTSNFFPFSYTPVQILFTVTIDFSKLVGRYLCFVCSQKGERKNIYKERAPENKIKVYKQGPEKKLKGNASESRKQNKKS